MALNYARSREYEYFDEDGDWHEDGTADLGRIRRQQYFIRSLANEAVKSGFRNLTKINDIINKTVDNITRDPDLGLSDILALAKTFREVDPGVVEMVTVPTEREFFDGQDAQVLIESEAAPIFDRLRSFGEAARPTLPEGVAPADVAVAVLNGSGVGGQARRRVRRAAGRRVRRRRPARQRRPQRLRRHRGALRRRVARTSREYTLAYLGGAGKLVEVDSVARRSTNVVLVLGRDFEQVKAPTTTVAGRDDHGDPPTTGPPPNPGGDGTAPDAGC